MADVLEVVGLTKKYPKFGLNDVNFNLKDNSITGFIGINGAGKTTTIKAVLGLIKKDTGSIKVFGKDMDLFESEIKNRIGVVFDDGYFYEDLNLKEMKKIVSSAYSNWDDEVFNNYITEFDLDCTQKISTLSKGMKMKFALALAMSHNADFLIMDEPTSGLDPKIRSELMAILKEFAKQDGKSVFFSTHITSDLEKIADCLVLIDKGQIVFNMDKDELLKTHYIIKGDTQSFDKINSELFISIKETDDGFIGLINQNDEEIKNTDNFVIEKPSLEDIVLGYIGG